MYHIHHEHALAVLRSQPFTAGELSLIEAAAACLPWEELSPMIDRLQHPATAEEGKNAAYALIAGQDETHHGLAGLCVFAAAMYGTAVRLHAAGIPRQVLYDTFCCLHRMTREYELEFGRPGFDCGFWIWRQSSGRLVRLGTLEFEYLCGLEPAEGESTGLGTDTPVLSVHIPMGADLSREALDDSYRQARAFYRQHPIMCLRDGMPPRAIVCESWLLSPTLRTLLGQDSGIRRFAGDFDLCHSEAESRGCFHFLFRVSEDTSPADLLERSSLQRAVKAYLLAGGGIGSGTGLLRTSNDTACT